MNIEISERRTFKFNDGWNGLDDWEHLGEAKVLAPRNRRWDGDSGGYTVRVIAGSAMRHPRRCLPAPADMSMTVVDAWGDGLMRYG